MLSDVCKIGTLYSAYNIVNKINGLKLGYRLRYVQTLCSCSAGFQHYQIINKGWL